MQTTAAHEPHSRRIC